MRVSDAFPSKYLSAADLNGQNLSLVISHAVVEEMGDGEKKLVLYFQHQKKGLVLNKTNATNIANLYGDDTDDWPGCELVAFAIMTEFQGQPKEGIRVRGPQPKDRHRSPGRQDPISTAPQRGGYLQEAARASQQQGNPDYGPEPPPRERDDR